MQYISPTPTPSGAYSAPQSTYAEGMIAIPEEYLADFTAVGGFVTLQVVRGVVSGLTQNTEAWEAWKAEHPDPGPDPGPEPSGDYVTYGELAEAIREGVNSVE